MGTAMIGAHALGHRLGTEQARRLGDGALARDPRGLNRVEPGTLDGQSAGADADTVALLLDRPVVDTDPRPHRATHLPGGVVPDQHPDRHAQRLQLGTAPGQELRRAAADRPAHDAAPPDLLRLSAAAQQHPLAGQGFRVGIVFGDRLFHQAQRLIRVRPGVPGGLGQSAPPHLIGKAQRPRHAWAWASWIRRSRRLFFCCTPGRGW